MIEFTENLIADGCTATEACDIAADQFGLDSAGWNRLMDQVDPE